ncbi:hypothetical protein DVH05_008446 [Phytophthora capsici]|nr:hypothetical protein DVH05_008446 [Phytophthora capsici]
MQTPSNETSYAIPVMTPQVSVLVVPDKEDPKERKMRGENQRTDIAQETGKSWDVPFFGCLSNIMPNCCMSTICPCVSIAQIQARLGNSYSNALLSYSSVIFGLVACTILFISHSVTTDVVRSPDDSQPGQVRSSTGRQVIFLCGALFFALFYAFSVGLVRMKVRRQYEIDGNCGQDFLAAMCCSPCTVAQMASQTQSYTPGVVNFQNPCADTLPGYPTTPVMPMHFI